MNNLKIITKANKKDWNNIVKSFEDYDIYYLNEYILPFCSIDKIEPVLIYFKGEKMELCYVAEKSDLANNENFEGKLSKNQFFDLSTPYGYGGPLVKSYNIEDMKLFFIELKKWARDENIISQFIRFHPLLQNHKYFSEFCEIKNLKKTVNINLDDEETIYKNMDSKCRNMVKKAQKNGIKIVIDNSIESQNNFVELYKKTMQNNNASDYYYFNDLFFKQIFLNLDLHCNLFNAIYEGKIISSAIIFHCNKKLNYHLSAGDRQYMNLAPNNLLLYEVACFGAKNECESFHLGGGVGIEDNLLSFKKAFNKNGLIDFHIGRNIFDIIKYNQLMNLRKANDESFNMKNSHMIGYRA